MTPMQTRILAAITEAGGWITAAELAPMVGVKTIKALQVHVARIRAQGTQIDGGMRGYRLTPIVRPTSCRRCDKPLSRPRPDRAKCTGLCRSCNATTKWTPESRAKASEGMRARHERERLDPQITEAKRLSGKRLREQHGSTPEMIEKQKAGRRRALWVPDGYEALNLELRARKLLVDERKRIIFDQVERDERVAIANERRRVAAMTPYERTMEAVRNGRGLVDKFVMPRVEPGFTLGGVSDMADAA
jgi:hypothetical protein